MKVERIDEAAAAEDDAVWRRNEPQSPCVKVCVVHPAARLCVGCLRSLEEIARWGSMPAADRARVLAELPARAPLVAQRRGGRAGRLAQG